jgi:hypothetical protein
MMMRGRESHRTATADAAIVLAAGALVTPGWHSSLGSELMAGHDVSGLYRALDPCHRPRRIEGVILTQPGSKTATVRGTRGAEAVPVTMLHEIRRIDLDAPFLLDGPEGDRSGTRADDGT